MPKETFKHNKTNKQTKNMKKKNMLKTKGRIKTEHQMNFTNTQPNDKRKGINKNEIKKTKEIMIPKKKQHLN